MLNKLELQGRMIRNPALKKSKDGKAICEFSVAWNYGKTKRLFLNCVAYDKIAENVSNFVKGQEIIVVGQLFTQQWKGRDGKNKQQEKLEVHEIHFTGSKYQQDQPKDISEMEIVEVTDEEIENLPW